jgi:topoisomerase-4 subunit A
MKGMAKHKKLFVRPMEDADIKRLLEIRIRRISAYDIEKNRRDIVEVQKQIDAVDKKLSNMKRTTIQYVSSLIEKYGDRFPRRTEITRIKAVDKKAVARDNIKLSYDKKSGFFGSDVRGDHFKMAVSEYALVLGIASDGTYRIMPPPEKVLFTGKLLYCEPFDPDKGAEFTVVYRNKQKVAYGKRIRIEKFIRNREYQLIKGKAGKIDLLLDGDIQGRLQMDFVPAKRQRVKKATYDTGGLQFVSPTARGSRLAPKAVAKIKLEKTAVKPPAGKKSASSRHSVDSDGQGELL